jgi:hypothetical protein
MIYERRAILSLLAMGRITAAEAERLMLIWRDTAWQQAAEWLLIAVACLAAGILQSHPHIRLHGFGSFAHAVVAHGTRALHNAVSITFKPMGGSV